MILPSSFGSFGQYRTFGPLNRLKELSSVHLLGLKLFDWFENHFQFAFKDARLTKLGLHPILDSSMTIESWRDKVRNYHASWASFYICLLTSVQYMWFFRCSSSNAYCPSYATLYVPHQLMCRQILTDRHD